MQLLPCGHSMCENCYGNTYPRGTKRLHCVFCRKAFAPSAAFRCPVAMSQQLRRDDPKYATVHRFLNRFHAYVALVQDEVGAYKASASYELGVGPPQWLSHPYHILHSASWQERGNSAERVVTNAQSGRRMVTMHLAAAAIQGTCAQAPPCCAGECAGRLRRQDCCTAPAADLAAGE